MMRAAFDGKNVWKAGGLSLLSSAASYGIGCSFGDVGICGHEMLRAGAHGLASGIISALDGGNFLRSFISGAAASGMGSYAQSVNTGQGPMVASTALMGGIVAWAIGDNFLQGAMRGMTIGIFNHAMHDDNNVITYSHDQNGNISGEISEVVVSSSRYTSCALIDAVANLNTFIDGTGASLKENGGNSTFGSNHRLYWHTANERGFYGNQYVRTVRVTNIGKCITKATGLMGIAFDVTNISMATYHDYQNYQVYGYYNGYNTFRTTAEALGGWYGAEIGATLGAKAGMAIGTCFGGIGVVPATIICGAAGGILGSFGGVWFVDKTTDMIYGF